MSVKSKNELKIFFFSMVTALVFLTICSKSSFLYPMNDGVDVNCFFSVGKAIANGKVLYRDIFEQKGPVLYFLYSLIYLVSNQTFIGTFFVEVIGFSIFLYFSSKCLRLYVDEKKLSWMLPLLSFIITTSKAFASGGQVEELSLPLLMFALYSLLRMVKYDIIKKGDFFIIGFSIGLIFWMKFTILGFYLGVFFFLIIYLFRRKQVKECLTLILFAIIGFLIISIPVLFYFIKNNALYDLWNVYFYNNIFVYARDYSILGRVVRVIKNILITMYYNKVCAIFVSIGVIWIIIKKNIETVFNIVCLIFLLLGTYIGGVNYMYYGLTISVFLIYGICALNDIISKCRIKHTRLVLNCLYVVLPICSFFISDSTNLLKYEIEEMPQYKFAKIINEVDDATLLNYGFLDGGFYLASDVVPTCKYFCKLNVKNKDMLDTMDDYVRNSEVDFIVTRKRRLEDDFSNINYECVSEAGNKNLKYYLYKRIEDM